MKVKYSKIGITFAVILLIIMGISTVNLLPNNENNGIFSLIRPVLAEETSFLNQEAGISAYTNVGQTIDLSNAKTAFRTIEKETGSYIVGSVSLYDYTETEDVHAYVNEDGWILSYYLKEEPAAKIVDWESYGTNEQITGTKLEGGISVVCDAIGVVKGEIKYYDFRYPNANKLMIVADALWEEGTDSFDIKLPSDFVFYERSYSHCNKGTEGSRLSINEDYTDLADGGETNYDFLSASQLSVDEFHKVEIYADSYWGNAAPAFSAIVLIYREG